MLNNSSGKRYLLCSFVVVAVIYMMVGLGAANVVLMGNNVTLSFDDVEANFGELQNFTFCACLICAEYKLCSFFSFGWYLWLCLIN